MIQGRQGITKNAYNRNAKYKIITTRSQNITGDDKHITIKYSYSRFIYPILASKYSYAI